jgi:hypothetical protein
LNQRKNSPRGLSVRLSKYEKDPGEEAPLGLILCAGKTSEQIELLQLDKSGIKVAE